MIEIRENANKGFSLVIPNGWKVEKIEPRKVTFVLDDTKEKLPKTWEECLSWFNKIEFIGTNSNIISTNRFYIDNINKKAVPVKLGKPLLALCQLLVCRDAYRQGWKPDWEKEGVKYCIITRNNQIVYEYYEKTKCTLSFQSEEVRDKFFENFRDLIEEAKELI